MEAGGSRLGTVELVASVQDELSALRERNAALEARLRGLEDFTAMAAHELLRPMILTEATAQSILERPGSRLDIASQQDLERVVRASSRVRALVEALLAGRSSPDTPVRRERIDLAGIVQHALELLAPEIRARGARITVGPMPVVVGDEALLNGAVSNLLANALKYGPRSGGVIHMEVDEHETGLAFAVESGGRPLPERDRALVFDPWRRGSNERRARGAGLGLAIVRWIVERHGGEVGVKALDGRGNRFYFTLPA